MRRLFTYLFAIVCFVVAVPAYSVEVTYRQGDGKGYVSETYATYISSLTTSEKNRNYGNSAQMYAGVWTYQVLLSFPNVFGSDEFQIPYGSTINSAIITLTVKQVNSSVAKQQAVYRVLTDWAENTVTYNSFTSEGQAGVAYTKTRVTSFDQKAAGPYEFNVTTAFQGYSDKDYENYGFYMFSSSTVYYVTWYSDNTGTATDRPMLTIDYTPPPAPVSAIPEPATIVSLIMAVACLLKKMIN